MTPSRLVALLPLLAAAGCYNDAPSQSTLPEPQYVYGPPGGAMDLGTSDRVGAPDPDGDPAVATAHADDAQDPDDDAAIDEQDSDAGPVAAAPDTAGADADGGDVAAPDADTGEQLAEAPPDGVPTDPTAGVTDAEIDTTLDGYGQWIETDDYGPVWRPDATVVGVDFTPYETGGSWAYTDAGWAFSCDYPWGWLPFHYGRWAWFHDYWAWVPGHRWGPAWVQWRHGGGVVGWRPLRPRIRDHRHEGGHRFGAGVLVRDHRHAELHNAHWRFATVSDLGRPHIRSHLYGNLAEGLRVTSRVKAPPVRARTTIRATDLMRNRFAAGAITRPGVGVRPPQLRDHRADPRAYQPPAQAIRPSTHAPFSASGQPQTYRPPVRTYQPPVRTYQPPVRTYQPPVRTYQPPVRTYQPPVRTYQPPVRTYQPPVHSAPPVRTYTPHAPSSPPSRSWSPPSHSSSSSSSGSHSSGSSSSSHGSTSHGSSSHTSSSGHHR